MTVHTEAYYGKSEMAAMWGGSETKKGSPITASSLQHDGGKKMEWNDHVTWTKKLYYSYYI